MLVRHRGVRDGRVRDRIKAVLLRDDGMSYGEIARVLFLSDEGMRQQIDWFVICEAVLFQQPLRQTAYAVRDAERFLHIPHDVNETINGDATIAFLSYLLSVLPGLVPHIILDQARYHNPSYGFDLR